MNQALSCEAGIRPPRVASRLACLATALALALPCAHAQEIPFADLGRDFQARHCGKSSKDQPCTLEDVLQRDYVHLRLGAIALDCPAEQLKDSKAALELNTIARGVLDLQSRLIAWLPSDDPERRDALMADIGVLSGWLADAGAWSPSALARAASGDEREVMNLLKAPAEVAEAAQRFKAAMGDAGVLGVAPQFVDGVEVMLCPSRREFMETIGFVGQSDEKWRAAHWVMGADQWTQFWKGPILVLALEYAPWTGFDSTFKSSFDPAGLEKDGRQQHVLNQIGRALLFRIFNRLELEHLERALAANLVIESVGKIAVLDGEGEIRTSGGETQPYSRFVPGGNPNGGILPPVPADGLDHMLKSRWRQSDGEDFFCGPLRASQKESAKLAAKDRKNPKSKDKLAHFQIDSQTSKNRFPVSAPFLGPFASEQVYPPPEYLNDYREFFKCYQTAFYHWLSIAGVEGDPEQSKAKFRDFLVAMGKPNETALPAEVLEKVYGVPISARDGSVDSLEWRFLRWLAAGK